MKRNYCGYNSFEINIYDFVKYGEENVLAVYVQTTGKEWSIKLRLENKIILLKRGIIFLLEEIKKVSQNKHFIEL